MIKIRPFASLLLAAALFLFFSSSLQAQLVIGKDTLGGKVAYIDGTGQHGLIAAAADQSTAIQWYNGSYVTTGATGTAIGTGSSNTVAIVKTQIAGSYAASLCSDLVLGGYYDWYLPSKDELNQLYLNKAAIGGFANAYYWSSTEYNNLYARFQNFLNGLPSYDYSYYEYYVRAVRAF
jgi:hypothetical protein